MKRLILPALLAVFAATDATAHGLYFAGGYGVSSKPNMTLHRGACPADYVVDADAEGISGLQIPCYPDYDLLYDTAWPAWFDEQNNMMDVEESAWNPGDYERNKLNPSSVQSYSLAIGWDFPRSPFRIEFEYGSTSFKSNNFTLEIDNTMTGTTNVYEGAPNIDGIPTDVKLTTMMVNTLFVLPFFDEVDPYIGFGVGTASVDTGNGAGGASGLNASQYIVGLEYRFDDQPWIVGLEYRRLNVPMFADKDNNGSPFYGLEDYDPAGDYYMSFLPTGWGHVYADYSQDIIMLKVRYDFISNDY